MTTKMVITDKGATEVTLTAAEETALIAEQQAMQASSAAAALIATAQAALAESDITVARVVEAVANGATTFTAPDVVAWMAYRGALRSVVNGTSTTMPVQPPYPART